MRKAVPGALVIGMLLGATLLAGTLAAAPVLAQADATPSSAIPSTEAATLLPSPSPSFEPVPTETASVCAPSPALTAAATTAAAPTEALASASPSLESAAPCESPAEPTEGPAATEAVSGFCALLTSEEIQSVVGAAVMAGTPDSTSCGWVSADPDNTVIVLIQDLALSDYDQLKGMNLPGFVTTSVNGIGDGAFVQSVSGTATSLYLEKGDRGIQVMVISPTLSEEQVAQQEEALAKIVAGRI